VFTARYAVSLYIKQIRFVFKGLISEFMSEARQNAPVLLLLQERLYGTYLVAICRFVHVSHHTNRREAVKSRIT
jgi:hypothetical protein